MMFYNLIPGFKKGFLNLKFINIDNISSEKLLKGENINPNDLCFKLGTGRNESDLVLCGFTDIFIISKRFMELLNNHRLTGCLFTRIQIEFPANTDYYLLSITGRSGPILDELSVTGNNVNQIGIPSVFLHKGLFFDLKTYDGSDFFVPEGSGYIFISEKANKIITGEKLSNVKTKAISDISNLRRNL